MNGLAAVIGAIGVTGTPAAMTDLADTTGLAGTCGA